MSSLDAVLATPRSEYKSFGLPGTGIIHQLDVEAVHGMRVPQAKAQEPHSPLTLDLGQEVAGLGFRWPKENRLTV